MVFLRVVRRTVSRALHVISQLVTNNFGSRYQPTKIWATTFLLTNCRMLLFITNISCEIRKVDFNLKLLSKWNTHTSLASLVGTCQVIPSLSCSYLLFTLVFLSPFFLFCAYPWGIGLPFCDCTLKKKILKVVI